MDTDGHRQRHIEDETQTGDIPVVGQESKETE